MREEADLTSYLLGERSELRALIEAIAAGQNDWERERAAVEYLLLLAAARLAARRERPEPAALAQIRSRYARIYVRDDTDHSRILRELHTSLTNGSAVAVITALKLLGLHHRRSGSFALARASFAVAAEIGRQLPDPIEQLNSLFWLGVVERYLGNLDAAEAVHREQFNKARSCGHRAQAVLAQENLGLVALRHGQIGEARNLAIRALNEAQTLEDRELQGYCYHTLQLIEYTAGRPGAAAACGWEAYCRYETQEQRLRALQDCGVILYEAALFDAARAAFEIVLAVSNEAAVKINAETGLADVAAAQGQRELFTSIVQRLLTDAKLAAMPYELCSVYRTAGSGHATFGDITRARHYFELSLNLAETKGFQAEAALIRERLSGLPSGAPCFVPVEPAQSEFRRLEDVGRRIVAERTRVCA